LKIGFFDSGHGGLDILSEALTRFEAEYFFIGDRAYHPYGALSIEKLHDRCRELTETLVQEKSCELIVVACNTATAYAVDFLRGHFEVPFVGVEPYLNYINHAGEMALAKGQVGALVTPNTLRSKRFKELKEAKDPNNLVEALALAELAPAIESFVFHRDAALFETKLKEIFVDQKLLGWKEAILGCTHYPLVAKHLEATLGIKCISPTVAIVDQMLRVIESMEIDKIEATKSVSSPKKVINRSFQYCDTKTNIWREALMEEFLPLP
jgi:glutamate racemase